MRGQALHDIEHGRQRDGRDRARCVADRIVRCHLKTMARMNVDYDLLTWEGDILRLQFWARAFEVLKETGRGLPADAGPAGGLLGDDDRGRRRGRGRAAGGARDRRRPGRGPRGGPREGDRPVERHGDLRRQGHGVPVLEVRAARARLPLPAVRARRRRRRRVWATTSRRLPGGEAHPPFGGGAAVYNVIDVRQSYLQKLLKQALVAVGHPGEAERSIPLLVRDGGALRTTPPASWATRCRPRTRRGRSSRSRGARGSA